jgi:hypothetical protein
LDDGPAVHGEAKDFLAGQGLGERRAAEIRIAYPIAAEQKKQEEAVEG